MTRINILFLADTSHPAKAVIDHINAITYYSGQIKWHVINPLVVKTVDKIDFRVFDAIGIHYSIKPYNYYYLSKSLQNKIANFEGLKFQFLQDEYQKVNLVQDYLYSMGMNILFTLVGSQNLDKAYPDPRLKNLIKIPVLTAYVPNYLKHMDFKPFSQRIIDVSYRARRCEYWLGQLAYEKQFIADEFIRRSKNKDLNLDISLLESDRVYGDSWLNLLKNSKAVLGTESGASIWDFDGSIEEETKAYLSQHKKADFDEVYEKVLKKYDYQIVYNAISPRLFEAAATRTPMILFPGEYNHICYPDKHYIALNKDFSNYDEVLEKLKDHQFLESLTNRAFSDFIESDNYSQQHFSVFIEQTILQAMGSRANEESEIQIEKQLNRMTTQFKILNFVRRWKSEASFIFTNFLTILCDKRTPFREKFSGLLVGIKRYLTYLVTRIKGKGDLDSI